jgi:hypothetical protein
MKKILLATIISIFFSAASIVKAQGTFGFYDSQSKNSSHITTVGDGTKGTKPLPVRDSAATAFLYVKRTLSFSDTTNRTMVRDTVSRKWTNTTNSLGVIYSKWVKYTVITDDTIQVSSDPAFPSSNTTTLLPGESFTSEKRDIYYYLNFYYRIKGWGTATVRWIVEGV